MSGKEDNIIINEDELFVASEFNEEDSERIGYSDYSYWKTTFRNFTKNKIAMIAAFLMIGLSLFALIQQWLPNQQSIRISEYLNDLSMWKHPPTSKHWFGTDAIGRDVWALVWHGTRVSLSLAILVAVTEVLVGTIFGAVWGYVRRLDRIFMELYNVVNNVPSYILIILISYVLSPGYWTLFTALTMTGWLFMARFVRNQIIIIRDREYNLASRCLGTPLHRMVSKNLIPHIVSVILLRLALTIPSVIGSEVTLTYLGVGLPPSEPSLGILINDGRSVFTYKPYLLFFPALIVSIISISFYIAGNAFADASDPKNYS